MTKLILKYSFLDELTITSEYGLRLNSNEAERNHYGMDFSANEANLYNANDGTVSFAGELGSYGNVIIVTDDISGESSFYAHLSSIEVSAGQVLTSKTLIGKTGKSGGNYAPHLHFEILDSAGNKVNPRAYLAESLFAGKFSTEVHVREQGYGIKQGDHRNNRMVRDGLGANLPTTFVGGEGFDIYDLRLSYTDYFRQTQIVNANDVVEDIDADGAINFNGVPFGGTAYPKTDRDKNIINNVWSLSGYDIYGVGDDVTIIKAGHDINGDSGRVTIRNYDHSANKAFRLGLGKKEELITDGDGDLVSVIGYNKGNIVTDTAYYGPYVMEPKKKEMTMLMGERVLVFGNGYTTLRDHRFLTTLDSFANPIQKQEIYPGFYPLRWATPPFEYVDPNSRKRFFVGSFSHQDEIDGYIDSGFYIIDENGKKITSKLITNTLDKEGQNIRGTSSCYPLDKEDPDYFYFRYSVIFSNGYSSYYVQQVDKRSYQNVGEHVRYNSNIHGDIRQLEMTFSAVFNNGNKIVRADNTGSLEFYVPKFRELNENEIPLNYIPDPGNQETPAENQFIITAANGAGILKVRPTPNSRGVLIGYGEDNNPDAKIDLSEFDLSQLKIYQANNDMYTINDLLSNDLILGDDYLSYNGLDRRRVEQQNNTFFNFSLDDDYYEFEEGDLLDTESTVQLYSVISFPHNQTISLIDVNASKLVTVPNMYIEEQADPTGQPSTQPTIRPSGFPSIRPSIQPSGVPSGQPTTRPSRYPFSRPTNIPSMQSTGVPTIFPRSVPTISPSFFPSVGDVKVPTNMPIISSEQPTIFPTSDRVVNQHDRSNSPFSNIVVGAMVASVLVGVCALCYFLYKKYTKPSAVLPDSWRGSVTQTSEESGVVL